MLYFLDGADQRGVVYEAAVALEKTLDKKYGKRRLGIDVVIVPVTREELLPPCKARAEARLCLHKGLWPSARLSPRSGYPWPRAGLEERSPLPTSRLIAGEKRHKKSFRAGILGAES